MGSSNSVELIVWVYSDTDLNFCGHTGTSGTCSFDSNGGQGEIDISDVTNSDGPITVRFSGTITTPVL